MAKRGGQLRVCLAAVNRRINVPPSTHLATQKQFKAIKPGKGVHSVRIACEILATV